MFAVDSNPEDFHLFIIVYKHRKGPMVGDEVNVD